MPLLAKLHLTHAGSWCVEFNGELVCVGTRYPARDLCRVLHARGLSGPVEIVDASTGKVRSTITDIARLAGAWVEPA